MSENDLYLTIASNARAEIKIKGSRFIGCAHETESAEAANLRLNQIRKNEYSATHNCYAFVVGNSSSPEFKYSDDGEPGGTAGRPIYDVIIGRGLTNTLVVVTRYFGGTKLGTGGLARAYSQAASEVLAAAGVRKNFITDSVIIEIDFAFYDAVLRLINKSSVVSHQADFAEQVRIDLEIRKSKTEEIISAITELTNGQAVIEAK